MTEATQKKVFTVQELTKDIRMTLEMNFSGVWIEGEVSNLVKHMSGHWYLSLKDENAQIQAVVFRNVNQSVRFDMKDGLKVLVLGKITVYDKRGQYQIVVERIEPKGIGALELALRQLTDKLRKEGLFDPAHKKPLPFMPERLGVITSPTGAVIRDILNISNRRFPNLPILLYPVKVQGEGAAQEIAKAIDDMNRLALCDVLIVGRGGGSLEDLWAFNEEIVVRAIFNSHIPIISAVGHEIDVTVSDLVADRRAATPSQAAEFAVPSRAEILERMRESRQRMTLAVTNFVADRREQVLNLKESYALTQPGRLIEQSRQRLDDLTRVIVNYPGRLIQDGRQKLESLNRQLGNYLKSLMSAKKADFSHIVAQIEALSPLAILTRGYSITARENKQVVRDAKELKTGEVVVTQLGKGNFTSKVIDVDKGGSLWPKN
ncbi:MAG: exodeoxyribonuclease VII large subunit [Candidatus Omnitrophica bacterium]|nr:exodeoxyribonuclease VII large subunit [Candidatus Omnitrophota bacterium]